MQRKAGWIKKNSADKDGLLKKAGWVDQATGDLIERKAGWIGAEHKC